MSSSTASVSCTLSCTNGKCFIDPSSSQPTCQCHTGYISAESESICRDVNECNLPSNNCNQTCQNTLGGYKCSCQSGYLLDQGDKASCHDINECDSEFNNCNQTCQNTPGSYKCSCHSGYVLDQRDKASCHDVDECLSSPCNRKGSCINTQGSFYCNCVAGWTGKFCSEDVNECLLNPCMNGTCLNTRGSYRCQCFSGFTGRHCETNINECSSQPCRNGAMCIDSIHAFVCSCAPGYTGRLCQNIINNCASNPCEHDGFCQNRINDFRCICRDNWEGKDCSTDVDECARDQHDCDHNAGVCNNTLGSYTCSCKKGYEGDGFTCKEKRLFDFGSNVGDTKLYGTTRDFNSPIISIPSGFPFDDAFYYRLYFSDNGLIIFQRNIEYLQYTYASPFWAFSSYFYGTPPMIAVFWDDADLTRGTGSIYYQVFDFQVRTDSYSESFQNDIKIQVNSYYGSELGSVTFVPKWALKITWEDVLPYSGYIYSDPEGTNTYQAVLTTDGIFSFCLIQFKDGGMNWKYYLRPFYRNYALMGYYSGSTSSSRDSNNFPAFNDPHTRFFVSPNKIYHPDQYPGFKTGKKGLWAYRLERNDQNTKNPRQKCIDWYIREPVPYWSFYTSPCPCSFWQAIFDRAFTWGGEIYYYGFDIKETQAFYITMQSRFPNWLGSGVRCYYAGNGGLIYGEKERFLPTPWTYYNWLIWWWRGYLFYRQQWNYFWNTLLPNLQEQYREMEVDPYHDCCRDSGDPFFCNLYRSRRPFDFCFGYIPPRIGFFFGDPHIVNLDSVKYTFNGLGEFILLSAKDENDTSLFRLQGRTLRAGENRTSQATSFVALAAQRRNGTKVQWNINNDDEIILTVDGNIVTVAENSTFINEVTVQKTTDNEIVAAFEGGTSITVSGTKGALAFTTSLDNSLKNKTEGLLGVWNDDKTDDFKAANGTYLNFDGTNLPTDAQIFFDFGLTWKTMVNNSIFTYNTTAGESWYTYNNNSFVPLFYDELLQTTEKEKIDKANETCKGDDDCIFDVLSTDDLSFGAVTLQSVTTFAAQNSTMNNFPPNITGDSTIQTRLDEPVFVLFTATDSNDDEVTFSVVTDSPDITITENGNFSWNPTSSAPVFAIIQANDSKAVSVLGLTLVLCNCSINSTCDYSRSILTLEKNNTVFKIPACNCTAAYTGDYCTEDFDACQDNQCFLNDTCKDQPAPLEGYTCDPCPDSLKGDGIKCYDVDECQENMHTCEQICTNVFGGFNCSCNQGYTTNTSNSSLCTDIDECSNNSTCPQNADCHNGMGNYSCVCKTGYEGDPFRFCIDVDECLDSNPCASSNSICTNTEGSFNCTCLEGYEGTNCTDIDECAENQNNCPLNSVCSNTAGSFTCQCKDGYESPNCTDIDECTRFLFDCPSNAGCENIPGSFTCSCLPGFKGNATFCEDIDECAEEIASCPFNETCENTIGNYTCVCPAGSERVNGSCQDIDECQNPAQCSDSGQRCVNTEYSFKCECKSGFMNINGTCGDINECLIAEENNCSKTLGICANLEGSYACQCKAGSTGDGITCDDTDECADSNICSMKNNTMCVNTVGSYNCTCQSGYDGHNCTDVDECLNEDICSWKSNSICVNTEGSFICSCQMGYDGFNCTDVDECLDPNVCSWKNNTMCVNTIGSYNCPCRAGYEGPNCTDSTLATPTTKPSTSGPAVTTSTRSGTSTKPTLMTATTSTVIASTTMTTEKTMGTSPNETAVPAVTNSTTGVPTTTMSPTTTTTATKTPKTTSTAERSTNRIAVTNSTVSSPTTTESPTTTTLTTTTKTPETTSTTERSTAETAVPAVTNSTVSSTTTKTPETTSTTERSTAETAVPAVTNSTVSSTTTKTPETTSTTERSTAETAVPAVTNSTVSSTTTKTPETTSTTERSTAETAVPAVTNSTVSSTTTKTPETTSTTERSTAETAVPAVTNSTVSSTTTKTPETTSTTERSTAETAVPAVTNSTVSSTTTKTPETTSTTERSTAETAVPAVTNSTVSSTTTKTPETTSTTERSTAETAVPAVTNSTTGVPTTTMSPTTTLTTTTKTPKTISSTLSTTPTATSSPSKTSSTTTTTTLTSTISTTTTVKSTLQTTQANITSAILFEYGQDAGDQSLPKSASDVISPIFKPEIDFTFGNARYPLIYFTDNGLIVLPASETEIFTYTNPFNKFTASSVPPMIAVFWSDADISGSIGNVFYQEYKTYGSELFNLTQNVERMISDQFKSKYKAKWTLKITWDKVPAATLLETKSKTNTYQAIITTDGSISFVLMLYESGGMNWDISTLTSKDLLIGFSSGDGFFVNDEQTKLPTVAERFRPDKYSGKNTDLKGLRLYSLIQGTPQVNYKANCLSWFSTEPHPSQWNQGLLSCPCSFPQGQADIRFRNSNLGATTKVLRSASPNANGAGQRCIYSRRNAFLEGWQERYWTSTPSDSNQNKKFDLDPYNWCCVKVDNPLFCDYYRIRRPSIACLNYRPPTRAMMLGDPHFTTLDGLSYTFNGLGDFVLLNVESNDDTIFKLHGRTVQTGTAQATNFMAFAVQHIQDKIITVQMILKGNDSIEVLVNNDMVQFVPDTADNQEIFRNGTFFLEKNGNASVTASFGSGISLTVTAQFEMLLAITNLPEKFMNMTRGLLGVWNDNPNDDFTMPNGSVIPKTSKESTIFNYGMTWEVPWENSIFTIGRSVPNNSFTPRFLEDLQQQNETLYNLLATECKNNSQCIFDAISTGKKEIGLATAKENMEFTEVNAMLNSYPPMITGPEVIYAQLFQQNISYYQATDQEGNNAVFMPYISQELNVTENGTLIWHPKTTSGISFEIEAVGSNNLSSVLRPQLVLCSCSANGECMNNEITQINGSSVYKAACNCTAGFTGTNCQDKIETCQMVSCFPGVDCSSSGCGSCPRGLAGNGILCIDIDECNSSNSCSPNATCTNIVQSYDCTCNSGFSGNGTSCSVINPCDSSPCSPNADCTNTAGNFSCTCKQGFTGNGTSCSVINPCDSSQCSPNADCTNTAGNFSCTCKEGFTGNGTSCSVINPCDSSPCSPNADCTNTAGNFSCTCKEGFTGNGTSCSVINPCDSSPCSPNANCTNRAGNFSCTCKEGFTGDGTFCSVINPCDSSPCSPNADCTNTAGNFSCTCQEGFTGNGTICLAVPCFNFTCPSSFCNNGGTCVPNLADGCKPLCQCPSQYKGERCTSPEQQFIAQPLPTLPKRSVNITLRLPNVNVTVLKNRSSTDYRTLSTVTASRLLDFLGKVRYFAENLEPVFWSQGNTVTTAVVSSFNYNGNRTVIDFLNNELSVAILEAFNGKQRFIRALHPDNVTFGNLNAADIRDITKLSIEQLLPHFSCNNTEFAGYEVLWDDQNGVICQSPCEMNYCLNQGECKHLITGPVCKCVPRTVYSSYGDRCEHLSMNLRAFFGILFGALAFLFLLMLAIFFIIWKCKKPGREQLINDTTSFGDTTFSFKSNPFSSKLKTTHILPSLGDKDLQPVAWAPNFDAVNSTAKVKIARPSVKKNGTDTKIP
ncbi:uncharacterized protein LOC125457750 isoform X2 [Stegostoma tigrinum]|uniref:uncharacterized protein LOC125457750 isoform X2 n=1 Tax=Stegostoma tigrinum TaxID=3053191 RepID=UPI0028709E96|nr:uncharacterized protein LOC125457750 isoform X2 [Stegostoma tigrinum]